MFLSVFLVVVTLGKGGHGTIRLLWDYSIFFGGDPWKMESWDLRLLWEYFFISFFGRQLLEKGVLKFEIAWFFLNIFFGRQPLEKRVWRCEVALGLFFYFFSVATLGKGSLEIWDRFGIIFLYFFWRQPLEKGVWRCEVALGLFFWFFWVASLWKRKFFFNKCILKICFLNILIFFKQKNLMKSDENCPDKPGCFHALAQRKRNRHFYNQVKHLWNRELPLWKGITFEKGKTHLWWHQYRDVFLKDFRWKFLGK